MPAVKERSALPALDRGLYILDQLIRSETPLRYNELRTRLPGIQDSTLSRILKALESYGYLQRDSELGYSISEQVRSWSPYLIQTKPDLPALAAREVDQLLELGEESAAIVLLKKQQLITIASRTQNDGIQILSQGDLLHFEADHAAAVGVLAQLTTEERKACLNSSANRFPEKYSFRTIAKQQRQADGSYVDQSMQRPGVCRIARTFEHEQHIGAVFFCLTQEACRAKQSKLTALLQNAAQRLHSP